MSKTGLDFLSNLDIQVQDVVNRKKAQVLEIMSEREYPHSFEDKIALKV